MAIKKCIPSEFQMTQTIQEELITGQKDLLSKQHEIIDPSKIRQENTGINLPDLGLGSGFSTTISQAQTANEKIDKLDISEI
jgi:hypothetical protein